MKKRIENICNTGISLDEDTAAVAEETAENLTNFAMGALYENGCCDLDQSINDYPGEMVECAKSEFTDDLYDYCGRHKLRETNSPNSFWLVVAKDIYDRADPLVQDLVLRCFEIRWNMTRGKLGKMFADMDLKQ